MLGTTCFTGASGHVKVKWNEFVLSLEPSNGLCTSAITRTPRAWECVYTISEPKYMIEPMLTGWWKVTWSRAKNHGRIRQWVWAVVQAECSVWEWDSFLKQIDRRPRGRGYQVRGPFAWGSLQISCCFCSFLGAGKEWPIVNEWRPSAQFLWSSLLAGCSWKCCGWGPALLWWGVVSPRTPSLALCGISCSLLWKRIVERKLLLREHK